jgi:hypothetical protein
MAIIIDEKNCPRPPVTDAEKAAVAASGAGRVADKLYPQKPATQPATPPEQEQKS